MAPLLQSVKNYLHEILKIVIEIRPWKRRAELAIFLTDTYDYYETSLFNQSALLMVAHEDAELTPATIRKHQEQIQKKWKGSIIYVQSAISSYNRKRLIEHHIPFIIPGNQMYLPHYGIDLREHFRTIQIKNDKGFSPGTQTVIIYALLRKTNEKLTPSILSEKLGYTLMTMTRAFNELKAFEIGEVYREGRERFWTFSDKHTLWMQVKSLLRNPIKKRIWIQKHSLKIYGGLSALSHFSSLSAPLIPVFAIGANRWAAFKESKGKESLSSDDADAELEIWNYDPGLFAKDGFVDPISLYCSLMANKDERVELAVDEMMGEIAW